MTLKHIPLILALTTAALPAPAREAKAENRSDCVIKGNINPRGERIYHLPGDHYYTRTRINPAAGERWFCTEKEARAAGWRRTRK